MIKFRNSLYEDDVWYYQLYGPHSTTGSVRIAAYESAEPPEVWLPAHQEEAQTLIDNGIDCGAFCRTEELRIFMENTPIAAQLATATYNQVVNTLANRTANQETIFLQLLALHARVLIASDVLDV